MVAMLMGDEDGIDASWIDANGFQAGKRFSPRQSAIDKQMRDAIGNVRGIARA